MRLNYRIADIVVARQDTVTSLAAILAVAGSVMAVSAGLWDAISHMQKEPEFFWSVSHMVVYAGVGLTCCAAVLGGCMLYYRRGGGNRTHGSLVTGIRIVMVGAAMQVAAGFGDSLSHDMFGIDGLVSWSHQPLELGLVLASLGGVMMLRSVRHARLKSVFVPFAVMAFLFFATWLAFNLILVFGHVVQCMPVYEIFSSGCAIL